MNKKSKGKRKSLMVSDVLHERLKIIAAVEKTTLDNLVDETLWARAKQPLTIWNKRVQ